MPILTLNHQRIFYVHKRGRPGKPTLLLVHGAGGSHLGWPAELRRLADYAVYALDLPGHGRSDKPGRASITAYADDVAAFIDALALEQVVIAGHSMGGAVAQMLVLRHPGKAAGLVLIGTGARLPVSEAILGQALTDFDAAVSFITQYAWARDTPAPLVEEGRKLMAQTEPQVLHDDFRACNEFNVMNRLPQIRVPTLVIAGEVDMMTPHKLGQFLADHIPNAELVTIEGGGHMMMLEQPGPVAAAIAVFLRTRF